MNISSVLHLMRIHQYIKNLFIFLPAFFSFRIFDGMTLFRSSLAFGLFCLCASAVYIINDVLDAKQDKFHPYKCRRPIASGAIQPKLALVLAGVLLLAGGGGGIFLRLSCFFSFFALCFYKSSL